MLSSLKYQQKLVDNEANESDNILQHHLSQSVSLLNSRMRIKNKQFKRTYQNNSQMEISLQQSEKHSKKFDKSKNKMDQSMSNIQLEQSQEEEHQYAVEEFKRQIEERYKLSIANKLYTFPRLLVNDVFDIISLSGSSSEGEQSNEEQQEESSSFQGEEKKISSRFLEIEKYDLSDQSSQKLDQKFVGYNPFTQKNNKNIDNKVKIEKKPLKSQKIEIKQSKQKYDFKKKKQPNNSNSKKLKNSKQYQTNLTGNNHKKTTSTFIKVQKQKNLPHQKNKNKKIQNKSLSKTRNERLKTEMNRGADSEQYQKYGLLTSLSKIGKSQGKKAFKINNRRVDNEIVEENEQNIESSTRFSKRQQRLKTQIIDSSMKNLSDSEGVSYDLKMNIEQKWKRILQ